MVLKVTVNSPDIKKILLGVTGLSKQQPQIRRGILAESLDTIAVEADRRVHVITGNTKRSINTRIVNNDSGHVFAMFGAYWEERRRGNHASLTEALRVYKSQYQRIIKKWFVTPTQNSFSVTGLGAGGTRAPPTYISKHRNSRGQWVYEYARTGASGGRASRAGRGTGKGFR